MARLLGKPHAVYNALYPDRTRGNANNTLDRGFRRRAIGDTLWVYGRIDIRPDDVTFIDGDQPAYLPPPQGDVPDLKADLARDPAFLADIKDDRFTLAVLKVFENRHFYKGQDARAWACGPRQCARLVADLRGRGESYQDYYPWHASLDGTYPDDRPDIERRFRSRIEQISRLLTEDPPRDGGVQVVREEDLPAWLGLGPGRDSKEEVMQAIQLRRAHMEKRRIAEDEGYRARQQTELEQTRLALKAFQDDHTNDDVLEALRAHLSRLGWRTETEQDR
jgi:hypothetical protein